MNQQDFNLLQLHYLESLLMSVTQIIFSLTYI